MKKINTISLATGMAVIASLAMIVPAFAQTSVNANVSLGGSVQAGSAHGGPGGGMWRGGGMQAGIVGTVNAVSGTSLTVTAVTRAARPTPESAAPPKALGTGSEATTTVTYTVDASNAKIYKGSATTTVSISSIATGDTVMVQGTVTGTNVAATVIRDGVGGMMGRGPGDMPGIGDGHWSGSTSTASGTPPIQGNGEPIVGGSVTAISGTMLTVTNKSNVTYTVDAASATVVKGGTSSVLSNVAVGDTLIVQGTVNGTSVTASSIIDQSASAGGSGQAGIGGLGGKIGGFFGSIGGFFQHLFGF